MNKLFTESKIRPDLRKEYIICAAIYFDDKLPNSGQPNNIEYGYVVCGLRYNNCWSIKNSLTNLKPSEVCDINGDIVNVSTKPIQGFLTSKNRFLNRLESAKIAFEAGQIHEWVESDSLASEELY
jgi:hypothetical protein